MAILNYTSKLSAEQTIGEIQKILSRYNVSAVMTEYDGPNVSGVSFRLSLNGKQMSFQLPCNWRAVRAVFDAQGIGKSKVKHKDKNLDNHAVRTAWRVMHAWIEAQMALVDINMATIAQVFLPYTIMKDGKTLAEHVAADPGFLLGDGK